MLWTAQNSHCGIVLVHSSGKIVLSSPRLQGSHWWTWNLKIRYKFSMVFLVRRLPRLRNALLSFFPSTSIFFADYVSWPMRLYSLLICSSASLHSFFLQLCVMLKNHLQRSSGISLHSHLSPSLWDSLDHTHTLSFSKPFFQKSFKMHVGTV